MVCFYFGDLSYPLCGMQGAVFSDAKEIIIGGTSESLCSIRNTSHCKLNLWSLVLTTDRHFKGTLCQSSVYV